MPHRIFNPGGVESKISGIPRIHNQTAPRSSLIYASTAPNTLNPSEMSFLISRTYFLAWVMSSHDDCLLTLRMDVLLSCFTMITLYMTVSFRIDLLTMLAKLPCVLVYSTINYIIRFTRTSVNRRGQGRQGRAGRAGQAGQGRQAGR